MEQICFRNLVDVSHTEAEARALAEEVEERMLPYVKLANNARSALHLL